MKKKILTGAAMIGVAALALTGCAADEGGTPGGEERPMVWYADVMDANPVATAVTQGIYAALQENGIDMTRSLAIDATAGAIDLSVQVQGLTRAVAADVDAIAYFVLDPTSGEPQINDALAADIPVFAVMGQPGFEVNAFQQMDDEGQGYAAAKYLADNLPAGSKVTIISGPPTPNVNALDKGAMRAFEEAGLTIVGDIEQQRNLDDNADGGKKVMQGILQSHPDIAGVFAMNDDTAIGAIAAAKQADKKVLFTSRNGTTDGIGAVKSGDLLATCDIQPIQVGMAIGQAIADHLNGVKEYSGTELLEGPASDNCLITKDNADDWKPYEEQVQYKDIPLG
jgi:ribose transport system substrate-binding protein